jgi:outer membrane protein assembly factor BamD
LLFFISNLFTTFAAHFLNETMKHAFHHIALFITVAVVFCGCNKYEKLLKNPDFALKYREANRFYEINKFDKAARLYENVMPFYRSKPQDDTINMQIARCYFAMYDYQTATYYLEYVQGHFLRSPLIAEADYMVAVCSYNQVMRAELDQTQTNDAIEKLEIYINKYPNGERSGGCQERVDKLKIQLAYKSYLSAKLYYQMELYSAAIVALKNSIKQYPESPYREELLFLILKSSYLHADNSIADKQQERFQNTIDEYLTLMSEYPESQYRKDAERFYQSVSAKINKTAEKKEVPAEKLS